MKEADLALQEILFERQRQDEKWGEQNHDPMTWMSILMEEVGEFAKEANECRWNGITDHLEKMQVEAVQVAAVAMAMVECLRRGKWSWAENAASGVECDTCGASGTVQGFPNDQPCTECSVDAASGGEEKNAG